MNFLIVLNSLLLTLLSFNQSEIEAYNAFPNLTINLPDTDSSKTKNLYAIIEDIEKVEEEIKKRYKNDFFTIAFNKNSIVLYHYSKFIKPFYFKNFSFRISSSEILPRGPPFS